MSRVISREEIEKHRTKRGGFKRKTILAWGIAWPPPKGWLKRLSGEPQRHRAKGFYSSKAWKELRYKALQTFGAKCMCCGVTPADGAIMNVDHVKPISKHPELRLELNNLQILCASCNHGKGGWDDTDWRLDEQYKRIMSDHA